MPARQFGNWKVRLKVGRSWHVFRPMATGSHPPSGNSVRLWDAATGRLVRELPAGDNSAIFSVAFSPTDNRLLAVGYGGQADGSYVALWDIDAGTELVRLPGATDLPDFRATGTRRVVGALAFSPDGKYLVAGFGPKWLFIPGGSPCPLKVWEVATRRLIRRLDGHTGFCLSLDFSKDGTLLASGSRDGTAILWSTATWERAQTLQNPDNQSLPVDRDGAWSRVWPFRRTARPWQWPVWGERAVVGRRQRKTSGNAQGAFQCGPRRGVFAGWSHPGLGRQ